MEPTRRSPPTALSRSGLGILIGILAAVCVLMGAVIYSHYSASSLADSVVPGVAVAAGVSICVLATRGVGRLLRPRLDRYWAGSPLSSRLQSAGDWLSLASLCCWGVGGYLTWNSGWPFLPPLQAVPFFAVGLTLDGIVFTLPGDSSEATADATRE